MQTRKWALRLGAAALIGSVSACDDDGPYQKPDWRPDSIGGVRVEERAIMAPSVKEYGDRVVKIVLRAGYRCDSISALTRVAHSSGYRLGCNDSRYWYRLKKVDGYWKVSLN